MRPRQGSSAGRSQAGWSMQKSGQICRSFGRHQGILRQAPAYCVDVLRAWRTRRTRVRKIIAPTVTAHFFYEAHCGLLSRLADRFGIRHIVLPDKRLHVWRRYQSDRMAKTVDLASPVMSTSTCLHGDHTSWNWAKNSSTLGRLQPRGEPNPTRYISAMHPPSWPNPIRRRNLWHGMVSHQVV